MSQFAGGKPGAWGRPSANESALFIAATNRLDGVGVANQQNAVNQTFAANQLSGFPTMGSFPMMGMGMPMGMVNQAAFSQPSMMGMGVMGAVPQQQPQAMARQPAPAPVVGNVAAGNKAPRTFTGVVTKMHDSYGFVDDDVFFQHSVIRGPHPRVGDKVMVEASYNPQMPFKWNAYRIQLLNNEPQGGGGAGSLANIGINNVNSHIQNHNSSSSRPSMPTPSSSQGGNSSRWGPSGAQERNGGPHPQRGNSPPRRRSPPPRRNSPPRRPSPKRDVPPRVNRKSPPRRSPPARRASPTRERIDRKRERSATITNNNAAPSSIKRDSASPPRRRARIIPRYECRPPKPVLTGDQVSVVHLKNRYPKLYVPSDFVDLTPEWPKRVPLDAPLDLSSPVAFHVWNKDVDFPILPDETEAVLEADDADHRHQVKVLLLAHPGKQEIHKKAFSLQPDGTTDDSVEPTPIIRHLSFLVGCRGKETMCLGGSWSPSLDGGDPTSPTTIIRTAIRTTKAMTGIDLSNVAQWYELVQLRYYRSDKDRVDRVHLMWPDTQALPPDDARWTELQSAVRAQLESRLAAVDALSVQQQDAAAAAQESSPTPAANVVAGASLKVVKTDPVLKKEVDTLEEEDEDKALAPSHWKTIDPKSLRVAELRAELEVRSLDSKGIKTMLVQRLQDALDKEKQAEEETTPEDVEMIDETVESSNMEGEETIPVEEPEKEQEERIIPPEGKILPAEKSEAEIKKEAEELQKKVEKLEKEKKEKKISLEKHYTFPKEAKVLVYPSKTAKNGKFDCKVMSLQSLLEYRQDDNKESQFEVSLFAEAFRELLERHAAFAIYQAIACAADKELERKRRDEARVRSKKEEEKESKDDIEKEKTENEKKEDEKVELKSIISNRQVFEAFATFDVNLCGYISERDLEDILYNSEFGITRGQVTKLSHKLSSREKINYRHLTDVLVDPEGNTRFTPEILADAPDAATMLRGYGFNLANSQEATAANPSSNGILGSSSNGTVVINGNVVNVAQKLALLKKVEHERDAVKASLAEQTSLIDQLREAKSDLEKKRKDLEKELDRNKKKLHDTGAALKASLEDCVSLKGALSDCKRYGERILSAIDKVCPPPKKEEEAKAAVIEEKVMDEEEPLPAEIVLAEEVGGDDVEEVFNETEK